jgi:hypothetical protein
VQPVAQCKAGPMPEINSAMRSMLLDCGGGRHYRQAADQLGNHHRGTPAESETGALMAATTIARSPSIPTPPTCTASTRRS